MPMNHRLFKFLHYFIINYQIFLFHSSLLNYLFNQPFLFQFYNQNLMNLLQIYQFSLCKSISINLGEYLLLKNFHLFYIILLISNSKVIQNLKLILIDYLKFNFL